MKVYRVVTVVLMNSKQPIKNQYRDQNQEASKHNILDKKSLIVITVHNTICIYDLPLSNTENHINIID